MYALNLYNHSTAYCCIVKKRSTVESLGGHGEQCQSMWEENRAGRGSGGTETVCELFEPSHSVICMANSLPEPALVCQRAAIQSRAARGTVPRPEIAGSETFRKKTSRLHW